MTRTIGTLTVKAILEHAATLENLRISGCAAFDSQAIQTLLCTAPRLKRFDTIATGVLSDVDSCVLLANDIIGVLPISSTSNLGWVCLELESFKCKIAGIPRPDIQAKKNGRPLTDSEYHDPSRYNQRQSRWIQQRVLGQLGRLTKLREITLGQDIMVSSCEVMMEDEIREDDYYDEENLEIGHQYQCLTMTLEDGLDQLSGLKNLRRLCIEKISHGQKEAEKQWMKEHWPVFGKPTKDMFWSSRGHDVNADWIGPDDRDRYGGNLWDWW
ncbi:hypothetical protein BGZ83_003022 [Gryganskiella cystojenkinii]|nr:hypothetical protein BGZ83_003022 [Gryganskiella cystojenkinii]